MMSAMNAATGRRFGLGWFSKAMVRHKRVLSEVLVASLFLQLFALVTPLIFQVVIDKVLTNQSMSTLDVLVIALLGVSLFEVLLGAMRHYLLAHATHRMDLELGSSLFAHLVKLPMAYFESRRGGETVARVRELDNARSFLTGTALTSWLDLAFALVFIVVMFHYSSTLTFVVLAALPVLFGASFVVTPLMRRKLEDKFAQNAENQAFLLETVQSMETLKHHAVEAQRERQWTQRLAVQAKSSFEAGHLSNATQQFISLASKLLTVALLYLGARLVIEGQLTVGGLIAFNMLAGRVNGPVLKLASVWQEVTQMKVATQRLADIMDATPEPVWSAEKSLPPRLQGAVELQNVSFRYAPDMPLVLDRLSLSVRPGEIVGVTGTSGSGKTTLMRLLARLYVPEQGRLLLDGLDVSQLSPEWLRRQMGVVGQDAALFNQSVRHNIALANPELSLDVVMDAARLAGAHDFVMRLPQQYDTLIGERGSKLSGGQRARIALARALVSNPRILLLDEATAALDYESEQIIHENMSRICSGRTVFIVAHRLTTLRLAHRVLVLEQGRIAEAGSHRDLLSRAGRYASLYRSHQQVEVA